jgi:hypothetical protein
MAINFFGSGVGLPPTPHHASHEDGGGDQVSVANLLGVLGNLQNPNLTQGLDAAKGVAGTAGRMYWATDTKILYRDSGAAWVEVVRGETATRLAQLSEKSHASLTNVTSDQHHARSHDHSNALDGSPIAVAGVPNLDVAKITTGRFGMARMPDGTLNNVIKGGGAGANPAYGQVGHGELSGVTSDQHHAQLHAAAHAGGGGDDLGWVFSGGHANLFGLFNYAHTNTVTFSVNASSPLNGYFTQMVAPADGDYIQWRMFFKKGDYKAGLWYNTGSDCGIVEVKVGGTVVITQDTYSASAGWGSYVTASFTIAADGIQTVQLDINGKNGSSTGYRYKFVLVNVQLNQ